jgi:dTDP-4-amino-4,6-dideoxygalactose transaminase
MPAVDALAREHGLALVEDAAQAAGAGVGGRGAGSYGIGCFSLYATKNLTSGEGGMLTTDDPDVADHLRLMRNQGMRERYAYEMAGHNYRMTDLQAAVALPQVDRYAEQVSRRRANATALVEALSDVEAVTLPQELPGRSHVWHQFTVLLDPRLDRGEVAARMAAAGVTTGVYYPRLVHDYDCYRGRPDVLVEQTPVAADVARRCLSLPVHGALTPAEVEQVAGALRSAVAR